MNFCSIGHRRLGMALLMLVTLLGGCRAMDSHDTNGKAYQNEQNRFYGSAKTARVNPQSRAYAWHSGALAGLCEQVIDEEGASVAHFHGDLGVDTSKVLIDTVRLGETALFTTGRSELNEQGRASLKRLVDRIDAYQGVHRIEIEGHTDARGKSEDNWALSQARTETVRTHLLSRLGVQAPMRVVSAGERKPIADNDTPEGMSRNRRVEVRIVADQPRADVTDATLCQRTNEESQHNAPLLGAAAPSSSKRAQRLEKFAGHLPLSVGDQLKIAIAGDEDLAGVYEVTIGGMINMPLLGSVPAHGFTIPALKLAIGNVLVEKQLIRPSAIAVDAAVQRWSAIEVFIRGAVWVPGRVTTNIFDTLTKEYKNASDTGDYARGRLLGTTLQQAGGVRPDADLANIQVIRSGEIIPVDISGVMSGTLARDLPLISGDEIYVPSIGYFQNTLLRPTQITPPGIRVFMSNPTVPIFGNAGARIDKDTVAIPYGTRLLRGLVAANCVGGTQHTNASRRAVLISTNPITGATEVIERSIQQLISDPDRDAINPHLIPNDGIACYDSPVSNVRDVARTLSEILRPFVDLTNLFDL